MRKIGLWIVIVMCFITGTSFAVSAKVARVERLFLEGNYDLVITESQSYIRSSSGQRDELYYLKGLSELKTKRFDNARASFDMIITKYPRSKKLFDAYLGLGDAYLLEGDTGKALGVYNLMAEKFPLDSNIPIVHTRMASCYTKMGLRDKAASYTNMAQERAPLGFEAKAGPVSVEAKPRQTKVSFAPQQIVRISGSGVTVTSGAEAAPGRGNVSIQVGSFKSKRNADALARKLAKAGYVSFVSIPVGHSDKFYRVKVGKFSSRDEASSVAARLGDDGYSTKICTDDVCE